MNNKYRFRLDKAVVLYAGIAYLMIPAVLFLLGWTRLYIALPLSCLLVAGAILMCRDTVHGWHISRHCIFDLSDLLKLLGTLLMLLAFTEIIGFHGHTPQMEDFTVRNPIYSSLLREAWPLFNENGAYFVYYHVFWLPPALVCKLLPAFMAEDTVLFLWTYLALALSALALFAKLRGRVFFFFLILLLCGNLVENLKVLPGIIQQYSATCPWLDSLSPLCDTLILHSYVRYVPYWNQFTYTFNHAAPLTLGVSLLLCGLIPARHLLFTAGITLPCSPLGIAPVLPFILIRIIQKKALSACLRHPATWAATALVLLMTLYLAGQAGEQSHSGIVTILQDYPYWSQVECADGLYTHLHVRLLKYLLITGGVIFTLCILLQRRLRRNLCFGCFLYLALLTPFVWIGRWNNELMFKACLVMHMLMCLLITIQWSHSSPARKVFIAVVILLCSLHLLRDASFIVNNYTWNEEQMQRNKRLEWNGSLYYTQHNDKTYNNFWGVNRAPAIFYNTPGESPIPNAASNK